VQCSAVQCSAVQLSATRDQGKTSRNMLCESYKLLVQFRHRVLSSPPPYEKGSFTVLGARARTVDLPLEQMP
jgi:hypothetical protein